ncbi:hypothetical protein EDB83DRAFT_2503313 [Lactarius deliciosus]|nr:hypothetical protein EDB83DRAFT_2508972 [Lactarius deliciosus]KAH9082208.1 hypothetical protein EDB83DRAFT_2503313 [Lactarius deliciosus]
MVSPPIQIFLTTIASQAALRQRQEYILRILQSKNIAFSSYDLASDDEAKRLWRRKAPQDKQQLPGILVGGTCPGVEAVEYGELETFLRLKETWNESIEETRPTLPTQPIGVPGASSPSQMAKPSHRALFDLSPASKTSPLRGTAGPAGLKETLRKRNESEFDIGDELSGYGLQGLKVTDDDLVALVEELGLDGEEAGAFVKGLSGPTDGGKEGETEMVAPGSPRKADVKAEVGEKADGEAEVVSEATP